MNQNAKTKKIESKDMINKRVINNILKKITNKKTKIHKKNIYDNYKGFEKVFSLLNYWLNSHG